MMFFKKFRVLLLFLLLIISVGGTYIYMNNAIPNKMNSNTNKPIERITLPTGSITFEKHGMTTVKSNKWYTFQLSD